MTRITMLLAAVAVALISILNIALGRNLIMPLAVAQEKGVGTGPWVLVWGMIVVTALCSLALVIFLISAVRNPSGR